MRWRTALLTVPLATAGLAFGAGSAVADCATDGLVWPDRGAAEGITFTGEVLRPVTTAGDFAGYRFHVDHVYAGDLGAHVDVAIVCVESTFQRGERYLVSGAGWTGSAEDPDVGTIKFTDHSAVAWHVDGDGGVELVEFGAGTTDAPAYLLAPRRLDAAVRALTVGDLPPTDTTAQPGSVAGSLAAVLAGILDWLLRALAR